MGMVSLAHGRKISTIWSYARLDKGSEDCNRAQGANMFDDVQHAYNASVIAGNDQLTEMYARLWLLLIRTSAQGWPTTAARRRPAFGFNEPVSPEAVAATGEPSPLDLSASGGHSYGCPFGPPRNVLRHQRSRSGSNGQPPESSHLANYAEP
jgi:hypothetical protein